MFSYFRRHVGEEATLQLGDVDITARSANSKVRMTDNAGVMGAPQTFTVSLPNTVKKYTRLQRRSRW